MQTNTKRLIVLSILLLAAVAGVLYTLSVHPAASTPGSQNPADTVQAVTFLEQGEHHFNKADRTKTDLDSALLAITKAYRVSKKADFSKGIGLSLDMYSKLYSARGDSAQGRKYADSAIAVLKSGNHFYALGFAYYNRSGFCGWEGSLWKRRIEWVKLSADAFFRSGSVAKQADILKELADLQQIDWNFDEALKNLHQSLSLSLQDTTNRHRLVGIYDLLGSVYSETGNARQALKYGLLALKTSEELGDTSSANVSTLYNRIGATYERINNHQQAYRYYNKGEQIALHNNDSINWLVLVLNKAQTLHRMGQYKEAILCLTKIPNNAKSEDQSWKGDAHSLLLRSYLKLKDYNTCRTYAKLLATDNIYNKQQGFVSPLITGTLAEYYLAIHDLKNAELYLKIGDQLYRKLKLLPNLVNSYEQWMKLDSIQNNFTKYIQDFKQFKFMRDSLFNEQNNHEIAQLQIEYETDKKNKDILLKEERIKVLNAENRVQQADLNHAMLARNVTIGGVVLLITIIALLYNRYRFKNKINRTITERNNTLNQLVTEKEWLLKEIHHRVKNNLQIIISLLDSQSMYLRDNSALNAIRDSQSRVYSMSLIHKKLYQSDNVATISMARYIEELVDYLASAFGVQHSIDFELTIADVQLSASQSIPIGLILNEAITNSIKYAFPGRPDRNKISIHLTTIDSECQLIIRDNGIGLPPDFDEENVTTLGISLMKGLSEDIEADFSIETRAGTYVAIAFRLEQIVSILATADGPMILTPAP